MQAKDIAELLNEPACAHNKKEKSGCARPKPGATAGGCSFDGAQIALLPIADVAHIVHGPIACEGNGWDNRGSKSSGPMIYRTGFTTDISENDIIYGGEKKLYKAIREVIEKYDPPAVFVYQTCVTALIGDDIEAVSKKSAKEINKPVIPVRCEGFRGVSQSLGHHIANDAIRDWVLGNRDESTFESTPYDVTIIGDYNIGGDAWATRTILEDMGLRVIAQWSGDGTIAEMELTPKVKLNLLHCYRSMNYISRHMEEKYGIPWMEYNFFGPTKIEESLRKIAAFFDDKIKEGAEKVIARYKAEYQPVIDKYRPRLEGKRVMLYIGGLRPRHVIGAYEDLGMEVVGTGYEFGHNDDYDRTLKEMGEATLIYDDVTGYEFEEFVKRVKPDLIGSGVKEKYIFQKMGVPFRQMHSWDYSGPYHGYDGFAIFARDMDMTINNPCWKKLPPPWKTSGQALAKAAE